MMSYLARGIGLAAAVAVVAHGLAFAVQVHAADGADAFVGSWSGKGRAKFSEGKAEAISCQAYYTNGTDGLGLALRCASPAYKVEIRSKLSVDGTKVTGAWEERTLNARGSVTGTLEDGRLSLKVVGGGFEGEMTVQRGEAVQDVNLQTRGIGVEGVEVRLARLKD